MNPLTTGLSFGGTRKRYVIEDPCLYLPLSEYESLVKHLQLLPFSHEQDPPERRQLRKQNAAIIKQGQERIQQANDFYHIKT
ncbi:hypothetical protein GCM10027299_09270 [Larkinella ripae]